MSFRDSCDEMDRLWERIDWEAEEMRQAARLRRESPPLLTIKQLAGIVVFSTVTGTAIWYAGAWLFSQIPS